MNLEQRQRTLRRLQNRLDKQAIGQLREELERLATRIDDLERQLCWAENDAEFWRDHAMAFQSGEYQPGITQSGELVAVAKTDNQQEQNP